FLSLSHPALLMSCDHRRVRSRFSLLTRLPPRSTLFPYTTLFRSAGVGGQQGGPVPFGRRTIKRVRRCCDDVRFRKWVAGRNEWFDGGLSRYRCPSCRTPRTRTCDGVNGRRPASGALRRSRPAPPGARAHAPRRGLRTDALEVLLRHVLDQ